MPLLSTGAKTYKRFTASVEIIDKSLCQRADRDMEVRAYFSACRRFVLFRAFTH